MIIAQSDNSLGGIIFSTRKHSKQDYIFLLLCIDLLLELAQMSCITAIKVQIESAL